MWRRAANGEEIANARGGDQPYVSPEGHTILDVKFSSDGQGLVLFGEPAPYKNIEIEIMSTPGVITTGLFLQAATVAVVAGGEEGGAPSVYEGPEEGASDAAADE